MSKASAISLFVCALMIALAYQTKGLTDTCGALDTEAFAGMT